MCLIIQIELVGLDREAVTSLAENLKSPNLLRIDVTKKRWLGPKTPYLLVGEEGGCACSLLSDNADSSALTWDMEPEILPRLAATISAIGHASKCRMILQALWAGDQAYERIEVTLEDLSAIAAQGKLGTRARYEVSAHG